MATTPWPRIVRFAAFEVDLRSRELRKHGLRIRLQEQPFRVLELLLGRPGELITREEFHRRIWPADTFVDFELGLNTAVKRLRQALGDSADTPRFIETLPRRGYRFIFPVALDSSTSDHRAGTNGVVTAQPQIEPGDPVSVTESAGVQRTWTTWIATGLALVLAASGSAAVYLARRQVIRLGTEIHSIAVLPLENLSADPQQEYFADGVTDEIITDLAKLGTVRVISRTSVLRYKHAPKPLPEIAKELDVDAVVEGTVTRSGKRVRITAQLIRARTEQHLWANDFEGDVQDTLALQDDVARAIANTIVRKLTPDQQVRLSARRLVDPEAYDAYMRGRYIFRQQATPEGLASAIREYTLAIEKDPNYAPAYAALADCYARNTRGRFLPPREAWARAAQAATKALQLDNELAEAHVALATIRFRYDWDWAEADREYKHGIELDPNDAQAYLAYSVFLNLMRRTEEGAAAARKAAQLDPFSANVSVAMAYSYAWAHRYDDAIQHARRTLELDPNYSLAHDLLARSYEAKGMWEQAVAEWLKTFTLEGMDTNTAHEFRKAFDTGGIRVFWRKWLESDEVRLRRGERPLLMRLARLSYRVGDKSASFGWLERAYNERDPGLPNVYWAADWLDPSRSDPRYLALIRRMGLPQ